MSIGAYWCRLLALGDGAMPLWLGRSLSSIIVSCGSLNLHHVRYR